MNRLAKQFLMAVTAALIAVTGVSTVYANDGMGISTMNVTIQDADQDMIVTAAQANVREAPGTGFRILHTLNRGAVVHVDGKVSNGWYRIWTTDPVYEGQTAGYISGDLLSAVGPSAVSTATETWEGEGGRWDVEITQQGAVCYITVEGANSANSHSTYQMSGTKDPNGKIAYTNGTYIEHVFTEAGTENQTLEYSDGQGEFVFCSLSQARQYEEQGDKNGSLVSVAKKNWDEPNGTCLVWIRNK